MNKEFGNVVLTFWSSIEFINCKNFTIDQIKEMKFKNFDQSDKDYLIICLDDQLEINSFKDEDEYKTWKNNNDNS